MELLWRVSKPIRRSLSRVSHSVRTAVKAPRAAAPKASRPAGYAELLEDLKQRVRTAQVKAALSVNRELIQLYWDIGKLIVERQERERWGNAIIDRLAHRYPKGISRPERVFQGKHLAYAGVLRGVREGVFILAARCAECTSQGDHAPTPNSPTPNSLAAAATVRHSWLLPSSMRHGRFYLENHGAGNDCGVHIWTCEPRVPKI